MLPLTHWIKIEHSLPDKPEVFKIAKLCGISRNETLGALLAVFIWYDQQLDNPTGTVTHEAINGIARVDNLSTAMVAVGWLREKGDELVVVNLERHNGKTAKQRVLHARNQMNAYWMRRGADHQQGRSRSKSHPPDIDKDKEKDKTKAAAAPPTLPDWVPVDAWQAFLEMRQRVHRPMTTGAMKLAIAKLEKFRAHGHDVRAVLEQSVLGSWTGLYEIKPDVAGAKAAALSPHTGFDKRDYAKGATNLDEIDWANDDGKRTD